MALTPPFQGDLFWWYEATYAGAKSGATNLVSEKVYDARMDTGEIVKPLRGISSPTVCGFISLPSDYSFHVEWVLQTVSTTRSLVTDCITRNSVGDLKSIQFMLCANTDGVTKSFYTLKGCKCKTFNLKASMKNEYICTADFSVASVTASTSKGWSGADPTASATGVFAQFNKPGHVLYKNTSVAVATIVDSVDITVNNNLTDYFNANEIYKKGAIPGALDVTGSLGISLDDGGKPFFDTLYTMLTNIYIDLNIGGYDIIRCRSARWNPQSFDVNTSNDMMKTDASFTAKDITWLTA